MSLVLLISGPAGVGKTTICTRLLDEFGNQLSRVITTTTRKPREGELNGKDYYFKKPEEFRQLLQEDAFLEHEIIHGNYYGTTKREVFSSIRESKDILINIDVKGAKSLYQGIEKNYEFSATLVSIFLKPMDLNVLKQRLIQRGSDNPDDIERRIETAKSELLFEDDFDHKIISNDRDRDYNLVRKIYLNKI